MRLCSSCAAEIPENSRFCFQCGKPAATNGDPDSVETIAEPVSQSRPTHPQVPNVSERFAPGTLLASRYRIIARLGKGGMGEVFRADDLVLGQPVALKFLPEAAKDNVSLLSRFYQEVRIARQISHKNVCRVYDIGEVDGQPFLSMEYIDGRHCPDCGRLGGPLQLESRPRRFPGRHSTRPVLCKHEPHRVGLWRAPRHNRGRAGFNRRCTGRRRICLCRILAVVPGIGTMGPSQWPQSMITWSRVLAGRWRDPMVGRDLLFGVLFGFVYLLLFTGFLYLLVRAGQPEFAEFNLAQLSGFHAFCQVMATGLFSDVAGSISLLLTLFLIRALVRNPWVAAVVWVAAWVLFRTMRDTGRVPHVYLAVLYTLVYVMFVSIMMRFGLFALVVAVFVLDAMVGSFLTTDFSAWYGQSSVAIIIFIAGLALLGFRLALGSRPLFAPAPGKNAAFTPARS